MDSLKSIDLGSSILSVSILLGFFALVILVLRTLLIGINYALERIRGDSNDENREENVLTKKGF
tara:strand:+ start:107 stop:298 length:192 start_codon:yes stop_codon:yes gene_type:complete